MSALIPAIISAGAGLVSSIFNGFSQNKQNKRNIEAQQQFNQDQMAFQERMFDRTNEYNLPVHQKERLEQAGLNPHLMYGSGGVQNTATAPSSSGGAQPQSQPAPQLDLSSAANLALAFANVKKTEAETKSIQATTEHTQIVAGISKKDLDTYDVKFRASLDNQESQTNLNKATYDVKRQEVENLINQNKEISEKIELLKAQKKLTDEDVNRVIQLTAVLSAQVDLVREQTQTEKVKRSNIEEDTHLKQEQVNMYRLQNGLLAQFGVLEKVAQLGLTYSQIKQIEGNLQKLPLEISALKKKAGIGEIVGTLLGVNPAVSDSSLSETSNLIEDYKKKYGKSPSLWDLYVSKKK